MEVRDAVEVREAVRQFTVALKGDVQDFIHLVSVNGNFLLGMLYERIGEFGVLRFLTEAPDEVKELLRVHGITFTEEEVLAVRLRNLGQIEGIFRSLKENELGIRSSYGLLSGVIDGNGMVLVVDDVEVGAGVLTSRGYEVLSQRDLCR